MKEKLKKLPIIGFLLRWFYSLLRLNNTKHLVFIQQSELQNQQNLINSMQEKLLHMRGELDSLHQNINSAVTKEVFYNMLSVQQRIDQFIFDSKTHSGDEPLKLANPSSFLDEYYLAFEDKFRGSRADVIQKHKEYLRHVDIQSISKALDIGCKRGEWVQLLQEYGIEAYGIETNYAMMQEALKYKVKNIINEDTLKFLQNTHDNSYDLITGFHLIEQIPFEKLLILLSEVKRVLKPNAKVIFQTQNKTLHSSPDIVKFMFEYLGFTSIHVELIEFNSFETNKHTKEQSYIAIGSKS